jgi:hypothetical protein
VTPPSSSNFHITGPDGGSLLNIFHPGILADISLPGTFYALQRNRDFTRVMMMEERGKSSGKTLQTTQNIILEVHASRRPAPSISLRGASPIISIGRRITARRGTRLPLPPPTQSAT